MKSLLILAALTLPAFMSHASHLKLQVELPTMEVAQYHAPYVATWLQSKNKKVTNLALWYDVEKRNGKGEEWLKDIRQWWRRSGRGLDFPVDGFSGATRKSGTYDMEFDKNILDLASLPAGDYQLMIEAVREVGGRELIKIPFSLPIEKAKTLSKTGKKELGKITISLAP